MKNFNFKSRNESCFIYSKTSEGFHHEYVVFLVQ